KTTKDFLLYSEVGLNAPNIREIINKALIKNLCNRLLNSRTKHSIFKLIKTIQELQLIFHCPLCYPEKFKLNNWIIFATLAAKRFKIDICPQNCHLENPLATYSLGINRI